MAVLPETPTIHENDAALQDFTVGTFDYRPMAGYNCRATPLTRGSEMRLGQEPIPKSVARVCSPRISLAENRCHRGQWQVPRAFFGMTREARA